MTKEEFRDWRQAIGLSQQAASKALGLSERTIGYYEAGEREDGRPYPIPKTTELACAALILGVTAYPETTVA